MHESKVLKNHWKERRYKRPSYLARHTFEVEVPKGNLTTQRKPMTQKKPTTTQNKPQSENGLGKFSESTDSYIDYEAQAEPFANWVKWQKSIDDVLVLSAMYPAKKGMYIPNNFPVACKSCRRDKKRDAILPSVETYEDAEKPVENQIQTTTPESLKFRIRFKNFPAWPYEATI